MFGIAKKRGSTNRLFTRRDFRAIWSYKWPESLFCKIQKHQPNKKQAILKKYYQGVIVGTTKGNGLYKYRILDLHDDGFYFKCPNNSKDGPYVACIITPFVDEGLSAISIDRTNGPIQIVTGNGIGYQDIRHNTFISRFEEYKNIMIQNGIPEREINIILNNPADEDIQESFFITYGVTLAEIMINIPGVVISLLDYIRGN